MVNKQSIAYTKAKMWRHARDKHSQQSKPIFDQNIKMLIDNHSSICNQIVTNNNHEVTIVGAVSEIAPITLSVPQKMTQYHNSIRSCKFTQKSNSVELTPMQLDLISGRLSNSTFFQYYHLGQSIRYLCARAIHKNVYFLDHISQSQAEYHVFMAKSYYEMTDTVRDNHFKGKEMESKMNDANDVCSKTLKLHSSPVSLNSGVLYTLKEVNSHYLKRKDSIVMSLPIPKIEIVDKHAYVPIINAIQYILAFAPEVDYFCKDMIPLQPPSEVHSMWQSQRGIELANIAVNIDGSRDSLYLYVMLWGDDFEGNNCKRGRNSAHIRTLSLSPPNGNNTNDNTVMISLGHKHWNHDLVDQRIWDELRQLQNQSTEFYHGGLKMTIKSVIVHACNLQDTPERRAANGIISAAGTFGNIIDHVIDMKGCRDILPSCDRCWKRRLNLQGNDSTVCNKCVDWDVNKHKCDGKAKLPSKETTRQKELDNFRRHKDDVGIYKYTQRSQCIKVPTRKRTYELLELSAKQAYKRLCLKHWSRLGAKQYLATAGVPEKLGEIICTAATNQRTTLITNGVALEENNIDLTKVPLAPAWTNLVSPLSACIPVPMHLWFHGITGTCFENVGMWLTTIKMKASMSRNICLKLVAVKRLSLENFNALEMGVANTDFSTAGYQGENYRCMALLFRWLFADLRPKLNLNCNDPNYIVKRKQLQHAESLIELLLCTICRVFKTPIVTSTDPDEMDRHCKMLLSAITNLQKSFLEKDAALSFHKAANFGALLTSVSDTMRNYPPFRTLWEGGPKGEGFLRCVKKHKIKPSSKSSGWTKCWMERVYRYDVFRRIGIISDEEANMALEEVEDAATSLVNPSLLESGESIQDSSARSKLPSLERILGRHKPFCSYRESEWIETVDKHRPISAVILKDNKISMIRRLGRELNKSIVGATITFRDDKGKHVLGGWYAPLVIQVHATETQPFLKATDLEDSVDVLLLPLAEINDEPHDPETGYYGVSGNWTERNSNNEWSVPRFSKATYT
jgi:hypothetical protein